MKTYLEMLVSGEINQIEYLRLKGYLKLAAKLAALLKK